MSTAESIRSRTEALLRAEAEHDAAQQKIKAAQNAAQVKTCAYHEARNALYSTAYGYCRSRGVDKPIVHIADVGVVQLSLRSTDEGQNWVDLKVLHQIK